MIRRPLSTAFLACALFATLTASGAAQTPTAQPSASQPKPSALTCTYSSRTYGDGAFVCVEKSLMLKCTVDETRASWSVVPDKDLSDRCRGPAARERIQQQRAHRNRRNIARQITPPAGMSSRCFNFNGRRYCE